MASPAHRLQHFTRKVLKFSVGVLLFWLTLLCAALSQNSAPWLIYGDFSWRTFILFFDNLPVVFCLSPVVFLTGLRLFGLKTPHPLLYALFAIPVSGVATIALILPGLAEGGTFWYTVIVFAVASVLFGLVYMLWPVKLASYKNGRSPFWFLVVFTIWSLFVLPWQGALFSLLSPSQRHFVENAAFGPSLEVSKSFVRDCQPFIKRYGQLESLELNQGFAHYDAEKDAVDVHDYVFDFEAERGQDNIFIDVPPGVLGFSVAGDHFCGKQ